MKFSHIIIAGILLFAGILKISANPIAEKTQNVEMNEEDKALIEATISQVAERLKPDVETLAKLLYQNAKNRKKILKGSKPVERQDEGFEEVDDVEEPDILVQAGQLIAGIFAGGLRKSIVEVGKDFLTDNDRRTNFVKTLTNAPKTAKTTPSTTPLTTEEATSASTTPVPTTTQSTSSTKFRYKVNRNKNKATSLSPEALNADFDF